MHLPFIDDYTRGHTHRPNDTYDFAATNDTYVCCDYDPNAKRYYVSGYGKASCTFGAGHWVPRSHCKVLR